MSINHIIRGMVNEIKTTREFNEFKQTINNLEQYPDIKKEIETLQKRQIELLRSKKSPTQKEQKIKEIEQQFKILSKHSEVNCMIKCGNNFNKMMSNIYENITN